ncbi:hypothetical protein KI387_038313, partial [Taxus chinensis]
AYRPYMMIDAEANTSPANTQKVLEVAADRRVMDAGTTEAYRLWWVAELQGVRDRPDI